MTQLTVFLTVVIVASCCLAMGYSQAASTGSGSGLGQASAKKIRVLSPAASRVYRLLHYGVSPFSKESNFNLIFTTFLNFPVRTYRTFS